MLRRSGALSAPFLLLAAALAVWPAAASGAGLRLVPVGWFDSPTYVSGVPGSGRLVVVERKGIIKTIRGGKVQPQPFLDIRGRVTVGGERGLLSIAFPPDYATSRLFYVYYTDLRGALTIEEYRRSDDPDRADPASARAVLAIPHPNRNHNSGQLQFGPDGYLYAGTGDGGNKGDPFHNAQNPYVLLGKILRIDPRGIAVGDHVTPPDNPFVGQAGVPPEIWAYGFRNPWRFSFDKVTGDLAIGDVGQDEMEEVSFRRRGRAAGANFGWDSCEGVQAYPPVRTPRATCPVRDSVRPSILLRHTDGYCSVIGGFVVRDRRLDALYGRYVYGDFCMPEIRSAMLVQGGSLDDKPTGLQLPALSTFGEDSRGRVYAATLDGHVYRIAAP